MDRDGNKIRPSAQKGVLLVFTALLLPVIFACAGLAVDLGNMYVHKSNLQNAVDAAALAGAAGYIAGEETAEDHPGANTLSDEYLKANLGREYQNLIVKDFQAQTVSGKTYYRVKVTQKSPVYFMTLLGLDPLTDVSADAVAQVGSAGSSSSGFGFKDLIVANHISDLGSIGPNYYYWWRDIFSPYLLGSYGIQATYDGNIVERGSDSPGYAFTPDAYNKTLGWAVADHNYFRLSDGGDTDYNSFYDSTERKFDDLYNANRSSVQKWNYTNQVIYGTGDYYEKTTSGNANVTIQGLDGESSKPIYVKIDSEANANKININIPETNNRPIVIIYTGTTKNGKGNGKGNNKPLILDINSSSNWYGPTTFTGVLYAPNADVVIQMGYGCEFRGSIYAGDLTVDSNMSRFTYMNILGGSSAGASTEKSKTKLIENSSLVWS
ncbi:MAG TPA: pilus assembly protein TadG-related protein [Veillonellaceae bacterium]|jgi:hypothetical protein|uniref:pilus assembly protein TadG-related protein n=1 Tax=Dialister massiliensis TaxID=2161821 RepID=UPI000D558073|nr:pilus assembly protein TadG-related protein [Dialister massiliensis]HJI74175.1 pilus assembly protein TadG-related protein [Veillonellaceae bacterium]